MDKLVTLIKQINISNFEVLCMPLSDASPTQLPHVITIMIFPMLIAYMLVSEYNYIYVRLLEKEIATYSCILAWGIPWMVEPGRLQSLGS